MARRGPGLLLQTTAVLWAPCQMAPSPLFQISADLFLGSNLPSADHTPWRGVMAKGLQFASGVDRVWTCSLVSICVREREGLYNAWWGENKQGLWDADPAHSPCVVKALESLGGGRFLTRV